MKYKIRKTLLNTVASISPTTYKKRIFKHHEKMSFKNLEQVKLKAEPLLLEFLLSKDQTMFDVGCHIGEYILFGNKVVPMQNIYAFEPNEGQFKLLKKTFNKANLFKLALSNENGTKQFKVPVTKGKHQTTRGTLKLDIQEKDEDDQVTFAVNVRTIDSFVEEHKITNLGLIKVDVEGAEMDVIDGALDTIRQYHPTLILELEKRHLGGSIKPAVERVCELGYKCYYFDADTNTLKLVPEDADAVQDEKYHKVSPVRYVNNLIFIESNSDTDGRIDAINDRISNSK